MIHESGVVRHDRGLYRAIDSPINQSINDIKREFSQIIELVSQTERVGFVWDLRIRDNGLSPTEHIRHPNLINSRLDSNAFKRHQIKCYESFTSDKSN